MHITACVCVCVGVTWLLIGDSGRLQYSRLCLFEMYVSGFFGHVCTAQ